MVQQGGHENSRDDGEGAAKARCEDEGKQLRFVAEFGDGHQRS